MTALLVLIVAASCMGSVYLGWWLRGRIEVQTVAVPKVYGVLAGTHQAVPTADPLPNPYGDPSVKQRMMQDAVARVQQAGLPLDMQAIETEIDSLLRSLT